jgi:general secretion pathway protein E
MVSEAMSRSASTHRPVSELLQELSGMTPAGVLVALGAFFEYPVLSGDELAAAAPAFDLLPLARIGRRECVVVREGAHVIAVIADPLDQDLRGWIEAQSDQPLEWALGSRDDIAAFLARHEKTMRAIDGVVQGAPTEATDGLLENLSFVSISESASPIIKLVHSTVYDALRAGASDIHLETNGHGLAVRYRIDGVLVDVTRVNGPDVAEQVISRVKVMSELDIAERRTPQDGRFKLAIDNRPIDFRVSIIPSVFGEDAVIRVLDKQALTQTVNGLRLDTLGFSIDIVRQVRRLSSMPYGMLLVTGPTGSGKTTTLYGAITETYSSTDKFVTIEDPVEYQLPGVLQIPVNEKKGLTFARGLRSILRHDPDKIMVGEIRDTETAQIAIQSALTGHLVFTTVHANNVFDVVSRFIHMGVDTYGFVSALNGVLAQRLIRLVCERCCERRLPSSIVRKEWDLAGCEKGEWEMRAGPGCPNCRGTGYRGRKAVGEVLVLNDELREAIITRVPARQLKQLAYASGVRLIRSVALDLVSSGETTLEEVNRVTIMA